MLEGVVIPVRIRELESGAAEKEVEPLHGPIDASNLYVTYSELHELLAEAFERSGQQDSALVHYRWVAAAWRNAEPPLRARADAVRAKLAALGPHT